MLHGRKGFDRIVWACKQVLDHSVVWLFCDLKDQCSSDKMLRMINLLRVHPTRKGLPAFTNFQWQQGRLLLLSITHPITRSAPLKEGASLSLPPA